jgi:hypothetical protein
MRLKRAFFVRLAPWAKHYRILKVLSVLQLLICIAIPIFLPKLNTGYWFLSFTLFTFWLSTYALVRLVHHHRADATGMRGWINHQWETILFLIWLITAFGVVLFSIKLVMYSLNP